MGCLRSLVFDTEKWEEEPRAAVNCMKKRWPASLLWTLSCRGKTAAFPRLDGTVWAMGLGCMTVACVCVYFPVWVCVCVLRLCVYVCMDVFLAVYACVLVCMCVLGLQVCVCVCVWVFVCVWLSCRCVCVCVCVFVLAPDTCRSRACVGLEDAKASNIKALASH